MFNVTFSKNTVSGEITSLSYQGVSNAIIKDIRFLENNAYDYGDFLIFKLDHSKIENIYMKDNKCEFHNGAFKSVFFEHSTINNFTIINQTGYKIGCMLL